jgi:hypothetical protein
MISVTSMIPVDTSDVPPVGAVNTLATTAQAAH